MADQREFKIGVLGGDGIGPGATDATIEVLRAASERIGLKLSLMYRLVGWKAREQEGALLSQATEQTLRGCDGWIMGPTFAGEYPKDDHTNGHHSGYLRRTFKPGLAAATGLGKRYRDRRLLHIQPDVSDSIHKALSHA